MVKTIDELINDAKIWQDKLYKDEDYNDRFLSWVHCYKRFSDAFKKDKLNDDDDKDYLALNLAFFLQAGECIEDQPFCFKKTIRFLFLLLKQYLKRSFYTITKYKN